MFYKKIDFWGTTSLGERGQIVIPAGARKALNLKKGDKLVVNSRGNKFLGILKAEEISKELKSLLSKIEK